MPTSGDLINIWRLSLFHYPPPLPRLETNSEDGIFLGIKYEPLSDPSVIKIYEWGPWVEMFTDLQWWWHFWFLPGHWGNQKRSNEFNLRGGNRVLLERKIYHQTMFFCPERPGDSNLFVTKIWRWHWFLSPSIPLTGLSGNVAFLQWVQKVAFAGNNGFISIHVVWLEGSSFSTLCRKRRP